MTKSQLQSSFYEYGPETTPYSRDFKRVSSEGSSSTSALYAHLEEESFLNRWPVGPSISTGEQSEPPLQLIHPTTDNQVRATKDSTCPVSQAAFHLAHRSLQATIASNHAESMLENSKLMAMLKELLEKRSLDTIRFNFLQNRTETLLMQPYRLLDFPIPRLFIILPVEVKSFNQPVSQMIPLRLYFLCECGTHSDKCDLTKSSSTLSNKFHLVAHEGYEIKKPRQFLSKFGAYVRLILQIFKNGFSSTSMEIPSVVLASLTGLDGDQTQAVKDMQASFGQLIKTAISIVEAHGNIPLGEDENQTAAYSGSKDTLEVTELKKLPSFLVDFQKDKSLSNLYRTVAKDRHVKWICKGHHDKGFAKGVWEQLSENTRSHHGRFDEHTGRIQIKLSSRENASDFFKALETAQRVIELDLTLDWDVTLTDMEILESRIGLCNISIFRLDGSKFQGPTSDILFRSQRFDPLISMTANGRLQTLELVNIVDLFKRINRFKEGNTLSNLRCLSLENCGMPKADQMNRLFASLPRLDELQLTFEGLKAEYVQTEFLSTMIPSRGPVYHLSIESKHNERDNEQMVPLLFIKNLAHLSLSSWHCTNGILNKVFTMSPQLEGVTISDVNKSVFDLCYRVTYQLRQLQHPLKSFEMYSRQYNDVLSVRYDQGSIEEVTVYKEMSPLCGISFRHFRDNVEIKVERGKLHLPTPESPTGWIALNELEKEALYMALDHLPSALSLEIQCFDLQDLESLKEVKELALTHPRRLIGLDLSGKRIATWLPGIQSLAHDSARFIRLRSLWFDYGETLNADQETTLLEWFLTMLSNKEDKITRESRMQFSLSKTRFSPSGWESLLKRLDYQELRKITFDGVNLTQNELECLKAALPEDLVLEVWLHNIQTVSPEALHSFQDTFQQTQVKTMESRS